MAGGPARGSLTSSKTKNHTGARHRGYRANSTLQAEVIEALRLLTRNPAAEPSYEAYVMRAAANPIARAVKLKAPEYR